jgi:protein SCO1/2
MTRPWQPTLLTSLLLALAGALAIWHLTLGLRAFTEESARRLAVRESPRDLPHLRLETSAGESLVLSAPGTDRRVAIVMFMYAHCTTLCAITTAQYRIMQSRILEAGLQDHVRLITVSFDPQRDTREVLADTAKRVGADPSSWHFARPIDAQGLPSLLDSFGIHVLPLPDGEFEHNAAFHVLDSEGRLARIVPVDQPDWALWEAAQLALQTEGSGS